ncbi:hypothetical protein NLJ89_g8921 [Agrocybe chaxingu]|uniref:Uncharacterized protein n=1 Tax=Agrocybe chaxingu TaxID=84603 RepID=A0A9W8MQC5_9AGAR|nr:hypothetical protein NLJ89_g8921 [Agrocybe chaxingu]
MHEELGAHLQPCPPSPQHDELAVSEVSTTPHLAPGADGGCGELCMPSWFGTLTPFFDEGYGAGSTTNTTAAKPPPPPPTNPPPSAPCPPSQNNNRARNKLQNVSHDETETETETEHDEHGRRGTHRRHTTNWAPTAGVVGTGALSIERWQRGVGRPTKTARRDWPGRQKALAAPASPMRLIALVVFKAMCLCFWACADAIETTVLREGERVDGFAVLFLRVRARANGFERIFTLAGLQPRGRRRRKLRMRREGRMDEDDDDDVEKGEGEEEEADMEVERVQEEMQAGIVVALRKLGDAKQRLASKDGSKSSSSFVSVSVSVSAEGNPSGSKAGMATSEDEDAEGG